MIDFNIEIYLETVKREPLFYRSSVGTGLSFLGSKALLCDDALVFSMSISQVEISKSTPTRFNLAGRRNGVCMNRN